MILGGVTWTSLIDFPPHVSTVLYTQGCNFNCSFCHNPELIPFKATELDTEEIVNNLCNRSKLVDAVVISGGEPTLQPDLVEFVATLKDLGFKIKVDTNGSRPDVIRELVDFGLVDFVSLSLKAKFVNYKDLFGVDGSKISETLCLLVCSGISYELVVFEREIFNTFGLNLNIDNKVKVVSYNNLHKTQKRRSS